MVIRHNGIQKNEIPIAEDGYIHVELSEFGWEVRNYYSQYDRLSYLITMFAVTSGVHTSWVNNRRRTKQGRKGTHAEQVV